jgi:riboflavin synthase
MFTGIVEDIGTVSSWTCINNQWELVIKPTKPELFFTDGGISCYVGASISVSGVCLTVTKFTSQEMWFGVAPETIRRTNFASLHVGSKVNLERASLAQARNSGHVVQGHVDCTAKIVSKKKDGDSLWFSLSLKHNTTKDFIRYVVPKGFVAVEGTSLTVCDVNHETKIFTLMLIDHTQKHVTLPLRELEEEVNIEFDVINKMNIEQIDELRKEMDLKWTSIVEKLEQRIIELENTVNGMKQQQESNVIGNNNSNTNGGDNNSVNKRVKVG